MIPDLPKSIDDLARLDFYSTLAEQLEQQGSVHVNWHTHKQNPAICWICDTFILISRVLDTTLNMSKSPIDTKTSFSSDTESENEIESSDDAEEEEMISSLQTDIADLEHKRYNEPEYDIEDEC